MHDDLIINAWLDGGIRGTSSDAYYINPHNLYDSTYYKWLTDSLTDIWINTDEISKVVRPFMVPRDIDDGSFDDCEYPQDGINALLNDSSEVA